MAKGPDGQAAAATGAEKASVKESEEKPATRANPTAASKPASPTPANEVPTPEKVATTKKPAMPEKPATALVSAKPPTTAADKITGISEAELARAWPCFRGRGGSGISPFANVPDDWDGASGKNVLWKSALTLAGNSSPVVVAGRIS